MDREKFLSPENYYNRELSWIKFNERVLNEAKDANNPLFERIKFLSITSSNLDEFFMVRVASLHEMVHAKYKKPDISGMMPKEQLAAIFRETHGLVINQYSVFNNEIIPELALNKIKFILNHEELNESEKEYVDKYFKENVYPVLTPMAVDSSRPFPLIRNKTLNIGALLKKKKGNKEVEFATVQVPDVLPRIVIIPSEDDILHVILLEEIIERNIAKLFLNYDILCAHPYRIMRNADLNIDEEEAADLLKEIEKKIKKRAWGEAIRLEVSHDMNESLLKHLTSQLSLSKAAVFRINGPIDLTIFMKFYGIKGYDHLKAKSHKPAKVKRIQEGDNIFECISKGDILLHHPYETFNPVIDFIAQAAKDENVLAIKQTLYRVSGHSPIISALAEAAENGKQVTVLVELKARFDEENNIIWARKLEKAGCHVIYGLVGLKTHSKITLVVRREEDGIKRYVHLGTGNYNDSTAKLYTDISILTCDEKIGEDATAVFNMLSGYSEPENWNKLSLAPLWLKDRFLALIKREETNALSGKGGHIIAKLNSLCDKDIIAALYEAASVGVKIDLIIRGICCLKVKTDAVSDNITVRSIVGEFLEHSRIYYFENAGESELYCSSADWMPRNLERRVEILYPVEDANIRKEVMHVLDVLMRDNVKASVMLEDGRYIKLEPGDGERICAHDLLKQEAKDREKEIKTENVQTNERLFVPREKVE